VRKGVERLEKQVESPCQSRARTKFGYPGMSFGIFGDSGVVFDDKPSVAMNTLRHDSPTCGVHVLRF
jgi:hypothetical protein